MKVSPEIPVSARLSFKSVKRCKMSSRKLRRRSLSVDSRLGSAVDQREGNCSTQLSPGWEERIEGGQNPENISQRNVESMGDEPRNQASQSRAGEESVLNPQLQAFLTTVMQTITSESAKLITTIQNVRGEIKADIAQVVKDLKAQCETSQKKTREEVEAKLASEISGVSVKIAEVARSNNSEISKISLAVNEVQATLNAKVETQIAEVRRYVDGKFTEVAEDRQLAKRNAEEILKVEDQVREIQTKLSVCGQITPQTTESGSNQERIRIIDPPIRGTASSTTASSRKTASCVGGSDENSTCNSITEQVVNSGDCTSMAVNATSEVLTGSGSLHELTLPTFSDRSKQVPLHFIRDLELYFKLKQTPDGLKLPLAFRAVQEPIAKQWVSSAYEKLDNYEDFKKGFTELLWNPNLQSGVRSKIYLDRYAPSSGESYIDHYIRYANLASTLEPPLQDTDLLSALISHYEPHIQQGLLCGNFKCTQDVLGYLSKVQSLQEDGNSFGRPKRDGTREEISKRSHIGSRRNDRPRDRHDQVNVRAIRRQTDRYNTRYNSGHNYHNEDRDVYRRAQGSSVDNNSGRLNPNARHFNPQIPSTANNDSARNGQCQSGRDQPLNN